MLYHKIVMIYRNPGYLYNNIRFNTDNHTINVRRKDSILYQVHKLPSQLTKDNVNWFYIRNLSSCQSLGGKAENGFLWSTWTSS